jgi:fido (protein-threonine AMPylation protein)
MSTPSEKLAQSLESLEQLQSHGKVAVRSSDLSRIHRERLLKNGFIGQIMKGWYIPTRPDQPVGESTAWFASFWQFCSDYFSDRFDDEWCLSPEHSLCLQVGNRTVPHQLIVRTLKGNNNNTLLPNDISILDVQMPIPSKMHLERKDGLNVYSLPAALVFSSPTLFRQNPTDVRAALAAIANAADVLNILLEGGHAGIAGRLIGGFRNIGRTRLAEDIQNTMKAAGYDCREEDPFAVPSPISFSKRERSPYISRMRMMWETMRQPVLDCFPKAPGLPNDLTNYLLDVQNVYVTDAYHSLSIEGYRVSRELIERVRVGTWKPDTSENDREQHDALAARGYWQSYQSVQESLKRVLSGENGGTVADEDHGAWYRELFAPSVTAGLLRPADLAGYRSEQVFIRHSKHLPPNKDAVRDLMPTLFDLLREERETAVRVVLGHFAFVYIHPYMDGNGRVGRFLMNVMLASGGFPWTVIPNNRREQYLSALEEASVNQNISPFAELLSTLVSDTMTGNPEAN